MDTQQYQTELANNGIPFSVKNNGVHLIVEGPQGYIDVWPTTGKWHDRYQAIQGFGLRQLVTHIMYQSRMEIPRPSVSLSLSWETAHWLKGQMQNPLYSSPENEPEEDSKARKEIWDALQGVQL